MPIRKMVEVENVNVPGQVSNVDAKKYEAMRRVLLDVLWWVKTVQLDLEAKGLIVRRTDGSPTRWHRF